METSKTFNSVVKAINEVRRSANKVVKDGTNPHFKSKYASLNSVVEVLGENLDKFNLDIIQAPEENSLVTLILHRESGEWVKFITSAPLAQNNAQGLGSLISYLRRYSLITAFGLLMDDDDGNIASGKQIQNSQNQPMIPTRPAAQPTIQDQSPKKTFLNEWMHNSRFKEQIDIAYDDCIERNIGFSLRDWALFKYQITEQQIATLETWYYGK